MTLLTHELRRLGVDETAIRFRLWRRSRQLRQWQAARLLGTSLKIIAAWETGRRPLPEELRARLLELVSGARDKCWCRGIRP